MPELSAQIVDPRQEALMALRQNIRLTTLVMVTLGVAAIASSAMRVASGGWTANVITDLVFFGLAMVVLLCRRLLPIQVVMVTLLVLLWGLTVANNLTLGLATLNHAIMSCCVVLAGLWLGFRLGLLVLVVFCLSMSIAGVAIHLGWVPWPTTHSPYLDQPQVWAMHVLGFALFGLLMLATASSFQKRLSGTLQRLSRQSLDLAEREQHQRHLLSNLRDLLYTLDLKRNITYVSPSIQELFGYTPEEALRLTMKDLLTPESLQQAEAVFVHYLSCAEQGEEIDVPPLELTCVRKDGTLFSGETKPWVHRNEQGKAVAAQGLLRDITWRKQAEEHRQLNQRKAVLSERLQALGCLAGGVAHDFNNQLMGIIGYADLMRLDPQRLDTQRCAGNILKAGQRAQDLIRNLMTFARQGLIDKRQVSVHQLLQEVIASFPGDGMRLDCHLDAPRDVVDGDESQLQNAFLNLVLNAKEAMAGSGTLTISTHIRDQLLEICFEDQGKGIAPNDLEHIFEPFYTTKQHGFGSGMGLPTVYGTVKLHQGEILVDSQPDQGSSFRIQLPLSQTTDPGPASAAPSGIRSGTETVLVLDDDEMVCDSIRQMLAAMGHPVQAFLDPDQALAWLRLHPQEIQLAVLDVVMPKQDGISVYNAIRAIRPDLPVLFVSGYTASQEESLPLKRGSVGFLPKPFPADRLSDALRELLDPKKVPNKVPPSS